MNSSAVGSRNAGVVADPLFAGLTRPPMRFGVTYVALLVNLVLTMECFLLTRNLLVLLLALPLHGLSALLCARDARIFDLGQLWLRTKGLALCANALWWKASSLSPLVLDLPTRRGRRRSRSVCIVRHLPAGGAC
jgi:type IV secretion system protein VirB3